MSQDSAGAPVGATNVRVNPYEVPAEQQGWRGLSLPGNHKRKWYTVLHNDKVLVTALITLPGETSVRHSHESGELSIHYLGDMRPTISWNPPGFLHGGATFGAASLDALPDATRQVAPADYADTDVARLAEQILQMQEQLGRLQQAFQELTRPVVAPRLIIDVLFPPFRTTIDDPAFPDKKTVTGQWFD
jgi:hypothetical protein